MRPGIPDETRTIVLSEDLQDFLQSWCNMDSDPSEAAEMLREPGNDEYYAWLPRELLAAARSGDLTPEVMVGQTGVAFRTQADVQRWLASVWPLWFGQPYPD
jgi:hypothetical protein